MNPDTIVLGVFAFVYAGMILGRIPGLALDRTGVALLGAIVLIIFGRVKVPELSTVIDVPTIALLFGLMVVSAQFRMSGFYTRLVRATPWPREILALAAAGYLLCSRRMRSREILGLVDWQLLVLFMSLFVVNHALAASGSSGAFVSALAARGVDIGRPAWLFGSSVVLSNLVSNVPAVMLLLPSASHPLAGPILALSSTLAGNLFIVGSIANIIVVDQAGRLGVPISWREHARVGVPVTLITLGIAAAWLALRTF
jgi:Na+/H+ antiporter NhaD/arsenite permease-like protein